MDKPPSSPSILKSRRALISTTVSQNRFVVMNTSALAQVSPATVTAQKKSSLFARNRSMAAPTKKIRLTTAMATSVAVKDVPTSPIEGQKTGTSGLRKKAAEFSSGNYLANWVQSLFLALPGEEVSGSTMVLGGDGRWFNKEAAQIIIKLAAGNGVGKMYVGQNGYLATPAASAVIRARKAYGGFIMSASHNPGGPNEDWGIKFNYSSGEPAPEKITDKIYGFTQTVDVLKMADIPDVDLSKCGVTKFGDFEVEVIDPVADYLVRSSHGVNFFLTVSARTKTCLHRIRTVHKGPRRRGFRL